MGIALAITTTMVMPVDASSPCHRMQDNIQNGIFSCDHWIAGHTFCNRPGTAKVLWCRPGDMADQLCYAPKGADINKMHVNAVALLDVQG